MFEKEITKDQVNNLPLQRYEGKVVVVNTAGQLASALEELQNAAVIGFDTESKPTFYKGQYNPVAMIQMAIPGKVFLIRISLTGFTQGLRDIFSNKKIVKAGISIRDDIKDLQRLAAFTPQNVVDLNDVASEIGVMNIGVRSLAGIFLGIRISKGQQTSNWERETLSDSQITYAATDAWVCLEIYQKLEQKGYIY
ncbi:3'-5' exonuclease [Nafulsella turpanensis]|uniref:3'-5' exonuclease n=1 Tax=Nafulsella turpanensis TaxID=1265690 RepID=UPI0003476628|nr:3'-5' exonuclease [Nafulsella turpanensis]